MAYKALIFGTDDLFKDLLPYYAKEVERGNLEIVAAAVFENGKIIIVDSAGAVGEGHFFDFDLAIISSHKNFYNRMKFLEAHGFPRNRIIDGRVFQIPNLDFPRLIEENIAYGLVEELPAQLSGSTYKIICRFAKNKSVFVIGRKSSISRFTLEGTGLVIIGEYTSISWDIIFGLALNGQHNYNLITTATLEYLEWFSPKEFYLPQGVCKIEIGNDVWIGRGSKFKCTNSNKPLIIGDGAVIASDSVVVKDVPPYAIVGGNPAQVIKYRFPPDVIEALLRIRWWDWDIDKIHDNFKYFNDIDKFISMHDKG